MNGGRAFLDTNVLVYLYSSEEPAKRNTCIDAVENHIRIISTQTLNEFCNVLFKKKDLNSDNVRAALRDANRFAQIAYIDTTTIERAVTLKDRYGYSYYDSLMLASALESGCEIIFSEDMSDGQIIEGRLKIINPFKVDNISKN